MKKHLTKLFLCSFAALAVLGCEDEDKNPIDFHLDDTNFAPYVRLVVETPVIDATKLNEVIYSGELDNPADNVASWDVSVRKIRGNDTIPYAPLQSITTFPSRFEVTGQELASTLGIPTSEIQPGDLVEFRGVSTGVNGETLAFEQLGPDLFGQPEQFQSYNLPVFVACPFIQSDAVGTYNTTVDAFGLAAVTFEVVPGPDENSLTVNDLFEPGFSFDIQVNPVNGIATVNTTPVASGFFGYSGGTITTSGGSFVFSCTGTFSLTFTYRVDAGSFGSFAFVAQKQ